MTAPTPAPAPAPGPVPSRRGFLRLAAGGAGAVALGGLAGCGTDRPSTGVLLASDPEVELPRPFTLPLTVPAVAEPTHGTHGTDVYEVTQRRASVEILPGTRTEIWSYDGTFPGPTFRARSGRPVRLRMTNTLPTPTATHLHGGVTPPDSDGYPTDLLHPVGHHEDSAHPMRGMTGTHGGTMPEGGSATGTRTYTYPLRQRAATLWYHDHRMDFSGPQVWRGLAGFFLVDDDEEDALPLPKGDRDIPLLLCDRSFDADGAFRYPSLDPTLTRTPGVRSGYMDGVLGDVQLVNGRPWPYLEVSAARYRLRLLNAANARRYRLALTTSDGRRLPFVQVGSDQGLLARPQTLDTLTMAPAERYDVVVDLSACAPDTTVTLVNTLADGAMRDVMRFHVTSRGRGRDDSRIPTRLSRPGTLRAEQAVTTRHFDFRLGRDDMWTVNGHPFDPARTWATPRLGTVERWRLTSDFHHPVHLHLAHFQVLSRAGGAPDPGDRGWKDTVDLRPYEVVEILARFDGHRGRYMLHCHNLEHEDMAMMANFRVV
ncbi:multicopper oxidase family protein [Streptomyces eurythermus]|uniref:multicopper oxidase family protein n=1 Tax=Streptomyces eurythermus TaxID=42237 RepID=UPI00368F6FF7